MCKPEQMSQLGVGGAAMGGIGSAYSAYSKAAGEKRGYEYQAEVARNNAQLAEWQATDAEERGRREQTRLKQKGAQIEGAQRAGFASRGVAVDEGSAFGILNETRIMNERDVLTARDNAEREAWALRSNAAMGRSNAGFLEQRGKSVSPLMEGAGTALTAGGKVADRWYATRNRREASAYEVS